VVVDLLFYSAQRFVYPSVILTVFFGVFMNDRNEYRESASDDSHHNRSIHRPIIRLVQLVGSGVLAGFRHVPKQQAGRR
jgi:hypothetical protein